MDNSQQTFWLCHTSENLLWTWLFYSNGGLSVTVSQYVKYWNPETENNQLFSAIIVFFLFTHFIFLLRQVKMSHEEMKIWQRSGRNVPRSWWGKWEQVFRGVRRSGEDWKAGTRRGLPKGEEGMARCEIMKRVMTHGQIACKACEDSAVVMTQRCSPLKMNVTNVSWCFVDWSQIA